MVFETSQAVGSRPNSPRAGPVVAEAEGRTVLPAMGHGEGIVSTRHLAISSRLTSSPGQIG